MASSTAVVGCTGLVGSHILSQLASHPTTLPFSPITTLSRRAPAVAASSTFQPQIDADTTTWAGKLAASAPAVLFSALGTTRADAGGIAAQWKIDHDLNVELVKAARTAGASLCVFVSSAGIDSPLSSRVPYSRMKQGVEAAVRDAGFEHAVILRPGMLFGHREQGRALSDTMHAVVGGVGKVLGRWFVDSVGQDAEVVARAAVRAAEMALRGEAPAKVWVLEQADIVRLGRDAKTGPGSSNGAEPAPGTGVAA